VEALALRHHDALEVEGKGPGLVLRGGRPAIPLAAMTRGSGPWLVVDDRRVAVLLSQSRVSGQADRTGGQARLDQELAAMNLIPRAIRLRWRSHRVFSMKDDVEVKPT